MSEENNDWGGVEYLPLFPSLAIKFDTNPEFKDYIRDDLIQFAYKERDRDIKGINRSNNGGWHSHIKLTKQENFLKYRDFIYKYLGKVFTGFIKKGGDVKMAGCWININGEGDTNSHHNHPGAHMSGVFWVKCNEKSGSLRFINPHTFDHFGLLDIITKEAKSKHLLSPAYYMRPEEGSIAIFPSSLMHHVLPNEKDVDRISIAFNLILKPPKLEEE